jgi:hypothetical protein
MSLKESRKSIRTPEKAKKVIEVDLMAIGEKEVPIIMN